MVIVRRTALLLVFMLIAVVAAAQSVTPIRYTLRFSAPQTNYLDVEAIVPTGGQPSIEMLMGVGTPGSYLIREYERNVEEVTAFDGNKALAIEKPLKNRWRITTDGSRELRLTYRVYAHEMTVRNNWVEADLARITGRPSLM